MPPRLLRPKDEPDANNSGDSPSDLKSNKRRAVSSACNLCRKRKSKCNGALPSCSTCTAVYRTECSYDTDSDHRRKGALKRDIQSLQTQNDALDVIVASLRSLPETEALSLLHSLRNDANPELLATSLRSNVRLPHIYAPQTLEADFAEQLSKTPRPSGFGTPARSISTERSPDSERQAVDVSNTSNSRAAWFRVPQDAEFVEHLLNLYFCWIHPFYNLLSREHFIQDMGRGQTDFCSAMLVNAVLALACHYSDRSQARTNPNDPLTAGDHFFAEAKSLLDSTNTPSLTAIQALGIMGLRETSQGRDSNGYQYTGRCVRMALEMGLHLSVIGNRLRPSEVEVRKVTFWGVFNLETISCIGFGRLSQLPRAAADVRKPSISERSEAQAWRPYEDMNLSHSPSVEQPLRSTIFGAQFSKLSELTCETVNIFRASQEHFTTRRLESTYAQYQEWYQNLPRVFQLENSSLPHVLILHMYYFASVLHLFRPYVKLDLQSANLYPREMCTFCANEISALMNALRAMYGLRRVCLATVSFLLSANTIHLLHLPSEQSAVNLIQGLQDFQAMSLNHPFAARCIDIIQSLADKWKIALPPSAAAIPSPAQRCWSSPISNFWTASIPRKSSSEGGNRSGDLSASHHDSPFTPPGSHSQPAKFMQFSDDLSSSPMDLSHDQPLFWTPFTGHMQPMQKPSEPTTPMHLSPAVTQAMQWPMFDLSYPGITL